MLRTCLNQATLLQNLTISKMHVEHVLIPTYNMPNNEKTVKSPLHHELSFFCLFNAITQTIQLQVDINSLASLPKVRNIAPRIETLAVE